MEKNKAIKNSAYYQRRYRQRLQEQGLVKKEVWILPENTHKLQEIETYLRQLPSHSLIDNNNILQGNKTMKKNEVWLVNDLYQALKKEPLFAQGTTSVEIIDGIDACLHIIMHQYGDLPLFLSVSNQQIIVEALLWPVDMVKQVEQFNQEVLCSRKLFPLSSIAIEKAGDGSVNYIMYGALSSSSILSNIIYELETLSDNVIKATEAYEQFLNINA